ncbi:hypothetical protein [Trebonia sp.]|uniref:hypothetical protein n=1 Tax=Trebonia sp. TaxID=2767075 RepID=UPI00261BBC26|nr:hypothetical protein [Trebonia sp.]
MSHTYAAPGRDDTAAGRVILMIISPLAAVLVIAGLVYAAGAAGRHAAAVLAAGCEPALFISGLPCTTRQMLVSQYDGIVNPAARLLAADTAAYTANQGRNLVAAEAALTAEAAAEQALGTSLAAVTFTPQNRARALALLTSAASDGNPVPAAAVTLTPQATVIADALIRADQALAALTARQARAATLTQMRSYNHQVQAAATTVQTELTLLRKAIEAPPQASRES